MLFDSVQVGVTDIDDAARTYGVLLGQAGERRSELHRFAFARGAVELVRGEPGMRSLRFRSEGEEAPPSWNGLAVLLDAREEPTPAAGVPDAPHAIDHVVVQSPDLDRAVTLWDGLPGVRLALDREFPQRGLRLLFFRSAGVTLEFSGALGQAGAGADSLWGIAYQVADLAACRARLQAAGAEVSEIRTGNKKGTVVATAKSHDLGVPTLLLQPTG